MTPEIYIILGLILLFLGRKIFWLFVAIAGFLVGMSLTGVLFPGPPRLLFYLVAGGAGLLGAVLAVFAERVAFALAGFYAGGYLVIIVAQSFGVSWNSVALFVAGGLGGALFAALIMDWAIILLSCLVGAAAVVGSINMGRSLSLLVYGALVVTGALFQAKSKIGRDEKRDATGQTGHE